MKVTYRKGQSGEIKKIVELTNHGFSDVRIDLDFGVSMPKVYDSTMKRESITHLILEGDYMVAGIGNLTVDFDISNTNIKTAYIGSVAVRPTHRGKGYMKKLMDLVLDEVETSNVDISLLSGQRQRYAYYEYYPSGYRYIWKLELANLKHTFGDKKFKYQFREITNPNDESLDLMFDLYRRREFLQRNRKDFLFESKSRNLKFYEVSRGETVKGYLLVKNNFSNISEYELLDNNEISFILNDFFKYLNIEKIDIILMPWEISKFNKLNTFAENFTIVESDQVRVYNFEKWLTALFNLTNKYRKLIYGKLIIGIKDYGNIVIDVSIEGMKVSKDSTLEPNIVLSKEEFIRWSTTHIQDASPNNSYNWFPLMFGIPIADTF